MTIRFAEQADAIHIIRAIQNKHMDYNTTADVKNDIALGRLLVAVDGGKRLGSLAIVYKPHRGYYALMRGCVYSKQSRGKGVMTALIKYAISLNLGDLGGTPWNTNPAIIHIFQKCGFQYQYTFNKFYDFYKKSLDK